MHQEPEKIITKEDIGHPTNFIHTYHVGPGDDINIEEDDPFRIVVTSAAPPPVEEGNSEEEDETDKEDEKKITKSDIGEPTNFRHSVHVGLSESGSFNVETDDEKLSDFLRKSHIPEAHLREENAPEFIMEFIDRQLEREDVEGNPKYEFLKNFKTYLLQEHAKEEPAQEDIQEGQNTSKPVEKSITKEDIGHPTDFQHVTHISCNENDGFIIETNDETLSEFFKKAGVTDSDLQNKDTLEFILDYIEKHLRKEKEEVTNREFLKNLKEYLLHFKAKNSTLTRRYRKKKKDREGRSDESDESNKAVGGKEEEERGRELKGNSTLEENDEIEANEDVEVENTEKYKA